MAEAACTSAAPREVPPTCGSARSRLSPERRPAGREPKVDRGLASPVGGRAVERPARARARHGPQPAIGLAVGRRRGRQLNRRVARPSMRVSACANSTARPFHSQRGRADGTAASPRTRAAAAREACGLASRRPPASSMCTSGIASVNASCSPCDVVAPARGVRQPNAWRARYPGGAGVPAARARYSSGYGQLEASKGRCEGEGVREPLAFRRNRRVREEDLTARGAVVLRAAERIQRIGRVGRQIRANRRRISAGRACRSISRVCAPGRRGRFHTSWMARARVFATRRPFGVIATPRRGTWRRARRRRRRAPRVRHRVPGGVVQAGSLKSGT